MRLLLVFFSMCSLVAVGQQMERVVVGVTGAHLTGGSLQMSFTAGEPFSADHATATLFVLTGFQQPDGYSGIGLDEVKDLQAAVYPNPSKGLFNFSVEQGVVAHLRIMDLTGKTILLEEAIVDWPHAVDLSAVPAGTYVAELTSADGTHAGKVRLLKQ